MPIWCCFEPTCDGLFTCAKQLQLNSYQFCLFLVQFKGPTSQTTKRTLLKRWVSLPNKDLTNIPSFSPLVHCSPVLTLFGFACTSSTWYAPICYVSFSLLNNQPVPISSLYATDRVGCVFTQQFNSIAAKLAKYMPKHPFLRTFLMVKPDAINPPRPSRPLISHN